MAKIETSPPSSLNDLLITRTRLKTISRPSFTVDPVYLVDERRNKWTGVQFRRGNNYKEDVAGTNWPPFLPSFIFSALSAFEPSTPIILSWSSTRPRYTHLSCDARPRGFVSRFRPSFPSRRFFAPEAFYRPVTVLTISIAPKMASAGPTKKSINLNRGDRARAEG